MSAPLDGGRAELVAPAVSARRGGDQVIPQPPWRGPGPPAGWTSLPEAQRQAVTVAQVATALASRSPSVTATPDVELPALRLGGAPPRPAAVLCVLFEEDGEAHMVLTRRSSALRSHTGEVAFPGGRLDPGEAPLDAAKREAFEEVGLGPETITILGQLSPLRTVSSPAMITPFVGTVAARPWLRPNPAEVARVFSVRLAELLEVGVFRSELWRWGEQEPLVINFFELPGETLWGATARMVRELLELSLGTPSANLG